MKGEIETLYDLKGILREKIYINRYNIMAYTGILHLSSILVITFLTAANIDDLKLYHSIIPFWGMLSYGLYSNRDIDRRLYYVIILPLYFFLHIVTGIFILKYRGKYPNVNISKDNLDRYLKIKKINRKSK